MGDATETTTALSSAGDTLTIFHPGDRVKDRYRVVRLVGKGGMGEVYEAVDEETGGRVALKTVLPELLGSRRVLRRFEREIGFSQRISHPNVLQIHEVFKVPVPAHCRQLADRRSAASGTMPCMVMEYLEGETVADRFVAGHRFSMDEARPVVCQMAAALAAAHRAGIVHRDLKPDNIFLVPGEDGGVRVVLNDFGVARHAVPESDDSLTASNVILGTPEYMAPEQLELEDAMPASDIYTFGLVMFEMVTGERPFVADTPLKMVFRRVEEEPPSPRDLVPELDAVWDATILRCLARNPGDRFSDPLEIITALDGPDSPWLRGQRSPWSGPLPWIAALLSLLLLAVVGVLLFL